MKNKKLLIIISSICLVLISGLSIFVFYQNKKNIDSIKNNEFYSSVNNSINSVTVKSINLSSRDYALETGGDLKLNYSLSPSNATNKSVSFTSSDPSVATVSSTGIITAKKTGRAEITIKSNDKSSKAVTKIRINVVAKINEISSIEISNAPKELELGKSTNLISTQIPSNTLPSKITWASDNPNVITVNQNGEITAVGVGIANIKVNALDTTNNKTVYDTVQIKVIAPPISCPAISYNSTIDKNKMYVSIKPTDDIVSWDWYTNEIDQSGNYRTGIYAYWNKQGTVEGTAKTRVFVDYVKNQSRQIKVIVKHKSGQTKSCYSTPISSGMVSTNNALTCPKYTYTKSSDGNNIILKYALTNSDYQYTWIGENNAFSTTKLSWTRTKEEAIKSTTQVSIEKKDNAGMLVVMDNNGSIKQCPTETFKGKEVTSINITNNPTKLMKGETKKLGITYSPSNAKPTGIKWSSANSGIVSVNSQGEIKGVGIGKTTITATSTTNNKLVKTITIEVIKDNLSCPTITYDTTKNKNKVYITVKPTSNTVSWDWYTNQPDSKGGYGVGTYAIWKSFGTKKGQLTPTLTYAKDDSLGNSKSRQGKIVIRNKEGITKDCYTNYFTGGSKGFYTIASSAVCPTYTATRSADNSKVTLKYNLTDDGYQYTWHDGKNYQWTKNKTNALNSSFTIDVSNRDRQGILLMINSSGNMKYCYTETFKNLIQIKKTETINSAFGNKKTQIIIEKGVSDGMANKYIQAVKNVVASRKNTKTGATYKMGAADRVYLYTVSTFEKKFGKGYCGMAVWSGNDYSVHIPANTCANEGTLSHELAHTADYYYYSKKGKRITPGLLSDVYKTHNKYKLNEAEFWANLYMRYYGYYKNNSKNEFTASELSKLTPKIESVVKALGK